MSEAFAALSPATKRTNENVNATDEPHLPCSSLVRFCRYRFKFQSNCGLGFNKTIH
jgi:hypothetical protein